MAMRAVPRGLRFRIALLVSRSVAPLLGRSAGAQRQMAFRMDSPREIALHHALESMTRAGTAFDPLMEVEGAEVLDAAVRHPGGMLIVGTHALLTSLILRRVVDGGRTLTAITGAPFRVPGTRVEISAIVPSPGHLFRVRTALRAGSAVCAAVDGETLLGPHSMSFHTPAGTVYVTPKLFRIAARCGAPIVFVFGRMSGAKRVIVSAGAPGSMETAGRDFMEFVRGRIGGLQ